MSCKSGGFRTNATSQIDTAHFIRHVSSADALKHHGVQIRFASRELPVHLRHMQAE